MKKILLLAAAALFTFSCSEYSDDGTPGDIIITNPDGTKKIREVSSTGTGQMDLNTGMEGMSMDITLNSFRTYAADSYSNETEIYMTQSMTGAPAGEETLISRVNETLDGLKITEISTLNMESGSASRTSYSFDYSDNQLASYTHNSGGIQLGTGTITTSADQISVQTNSQAETFIPLDWVFNLTEGVISSATGTDNSGSGVYTVDFTRSNGNITGLNISSGSNSSAYSYSYDTNMNPFHQVYTDALDRTNAEIVRIISSGFSSQAGGSSLDVSNLESSLRGMLIEGTNNITQVSSNGQSLETRSFTYDEEGYPVTMTSDIQQTVNLGNSMNQFIDIFTEMFAGMGLSQEEIDEMIAGITDSLAGDVSIDTTLEATISYYE